MGGGDIVLATINATWSHPSVALRSLRANLASLRERSRLVELDPRRPPAEAARDLLASDPKIVALAVYIWNVALLTEVARHLKEQRPDVVLVIGGPEVSYEWERQPIAQLADYLIMREGELVFAELCRRLLGGDHPGERIIDGGRPDPARLALPYDEYTDVDVTSRFVYVETTRGCPFGCEFCISCLDRRVREWPLEPVLEALDRLIRRGARRIKFVDRTFNLDMDRAERVLRFLRDRLRPGLSVHFEFVPRLPTPRVAGLLAEFPPGTLRLEIGVQTFDERVNALVGRRQTPGEVEELLTFLRDRTAAHVHADLLAGLPGSTPELLRDDFDRLLTFRPAEIQIGILKRLRGTPLAAKADSWGLEFDTNPPYRVLRTPGWTPEQLDRLVHAARFWERLVNRGQFPKTWERLCRGAVSSFETLMGLTDRLLAHFGRSHSIARPEMAAALFEELIRRGISRDEAAAALAADGARGRRARSGSEAGP